jgi:hypothetical protein
MNLLRLFHRHDWRDTRTGWRPPHFIIPSVEGPAIPREYVCSKCGAREVKSA